MADQQKQEHTKKVPVQRKPRNFFLIGFLVLCGIAIILMVITAWQMQQYTAYKLQKESIQATLLGETEATQEQVADLEAGFIKEGSVITFIESIETARPYFEEFAINFVSDVPEGNKAPRYLPVNFTLMGSYKNATTFVEGLLSAPYVIRIKRLDMSSTDAFTDQVRLSLSAELYVSEEFSKK